MLQKNISFTFFQLRWNLFLMRTPKLGSSSDTTAPIYSGNTLMFPAIEKPKLPSLAWPTISSKEWVQTRSRHPILVEGAGSSDEVPLSRAAKRARLQVPDLPSPGCSRTADRDLQALMIAFQNDVEVDMPDSLDQTEATVSTPIEEDADGLWALLEAFDENAMVDSTEISSADIDTKIPGVESSLSGSDDRRASMTKFAGSNSLNPVSDQAIQSTSVLTYLDTLRNLQPTDMSRYMRVTVAGMGELPPEGNRLAAAEVILATFEGPLRNSVMHTLPLCCDVIRHLSTVKDRNEVSQRIEKIALTEPFYFRMEVMLATLDATRGTPPHWQPY